MKSYTFGYLFVRLNIVLAILVVIGGVLLSAFLFFQAQSESAASTYSESEVLSGRLRDLQDTLLQTQFRIAQFRHATAYPPEYDAGNAKPEFQGQYVNGSDFIALHKTLRQVDASRQAIKSYLIAQFEISVQTIRNTLLAHASQIREETMGTANQQSTPPPSMSSGADAVPDDSRLFSTALKNEDLDARRTFLQNARQLLSVLESVSENSQNKSVLGASIIEIDNLSGLLPQPVEVQAESGPPIQGSSTPPPPRLNAEKVADQLLQIQSGVDEAMTSAWTLDEKYEEALDAYSTESDKCKSAERQVRGIWRESAFAITKTIIASVCVAFGLMVLADLTKAILDTAASTGVVGAAYSAANFPEDSETGPSGDVPNDPE
jgi:hypothetical protein